MSALIVVDNPKNWPLEIRGVEVVSSRDYLTLPKYAAMSRAKVFNLCRSYRYQAAGYYVSLLAQARGHRPLPSVGTRQDLRLSPVVRIAAHEMDDLIQNALKPLKSDKFELSVYFGSNVTPRYDRLGLAIFNQFPAPFLRVQFERDGASDDRSEWSIKSVRIIGADEIPPEHHAFAVSKAEEHIQRGHRSRKNKSSAKYDLAILHDPDDQMPPSDPKALKRFVAAAESVGMRPWLITREDYGSLAEFDALFIRETTSVNHHTFRFARRAAAEGMVVIDDPESILRCSNKVFLAELLSRHKLMTPATVIFSMDNANLVGERIGFPCVIKQPDSAFSQGVVKIDTEEAFKAQLEQLFETSELLLAQEFVPTDFDWRIGVLGGRALFACKYFMARKHWQIIKREGSTSRFGKFESLPVHQAPQKVVSAAVKAANLIGNGLYGVDLKVLGGKPKIIEVNDNPSIDAGIEDKVLGNLLYEQIMLHIMMQLEERGR
ncbi:MAG: RimK family protein [Phycisphaerales bacterium]|nr:RimK family protein [Phycisphaerales bacterium]